MKIMNFLCNNNNIFKIIFFHMGTLKNTKIPLRSFGPRGLSESTRWKEPGSPHNIYWDGTGSLLVTPTSISELVLQFLIALSSAGLNFILNHLLPDPHLIDKKCWYLVYSNSETKPAI